MGSLWLQRALCENGCDLTMVVGRKRSNDPAILPESNMLDYRPYYAISESGYWTFFGGRSMLAQYHTTYYR